MNQATYVSIVAEEHTQLEADSLVPDMVLQDSSREIEQEESVDTQVHEVREH